MVQQAAARVILAMLAIYHEYALRHMPTIYGLRDNAYATPCVAMPT